ncbi:RND transporter [Burkholderia sp. MSMB617WGS]|uniref:efflux transporter outer membrane subunit n=1 Tax=Burkholderia sp. MSMB617WGS TaxID=1637831 RepID=UPI00075F7A7F|nr:efflux transporter outer membrane subunit [Burkholderia sp. MSMB617WGS]AOK47276.1 RND transporter [Burkholderia sp. MSMB617WGS]
MAGCASMGDVAPQAKQIDPASLDAGAAIAAADRDAGWPASDWWRAYRDPQLDAWIAASLAGNPSLAAAQARVREAQSLARIAHAEELPQLNGSLSLMRQHWPDNVYYGPGPLANADTWNNTGALSLSYHLDLWGKDKNNARRALDTARASAADARAAQLELEANVVRAYVDFAKDYALLDIAHATYDRQNELAELARKRLRAGIGTQLEVSQAEAPLPDYARQIDSYEEAIQLGRHQLAALAGKGPGAGAPLARPKLALDADASLPSALPAELIGRRPDVVAARWTVDAQARGIDVAKAAFYPNVDLIASLGGFAVSAPFATFLRAMNGGWSAGPALTLPIFEGGRLRAQLGVASAGYDEAVERYNQTIVGALKDIADNVVRLHSLDSQQKDAARAVALTRRSYDLSHTGFSRGLTDYVNVLLAQSQLLTAQENQARVEAARLAAHASLMIALGGGLETAGDAPHDAPAGDARRASAPNPPAASADASASTKSGAPAAADAPAGSGASASASASASSSSSSSSSSSASASSAGGRAAAASRASATAAAATASGLTAAVAGASAPTSAATSASATAAPAAR